MNRYSGDETEICEGCAHFPTKLEAAPDEISEQIGRSFELGELKESGAVFNYPDALTSLEWVCLRGLTRGRARAEKLADERRAKENKG